MRGSKSQGPGVAIERILMSLPCGELLRAELVVQDEQKLTAGLEALAESIASFPPCECAILC